MQKVIKVLLLILSFIFVLPMDTASAVDAYKGGKTVRVGYFESPSFFNGAYEGGRKSGYGYEYLQEIANHTNWEYKYVYGEWSELFAALERGEIDILADVSITPERLQKISFPVQPMGKEEYCIVVPLNSTIIAADLSTIEGKRIGVLSKAVYCDMLIKWLTERGINAQIVYYDSDANRKEDLSIGKIDASVEVETGISGQLAQIATVGEAEFYLAVAPNRGDLLFELNEALDEMKREMPFYTRMLRQFYYARSLVNRELNEAEQNWLVQHGETIKVGLVENDLPLSYQDKKSGRPDGLAPRLLRRIFGNLNTSMPKFEFVFFKTQHGMEEALYSGRVDIVFPMPQTNWPVSRGQLMLSSMVKMMPMSLVFKDNFTDTKLKSLAVPTGYVDKYIAELVLPQAERMPLQTREDCVRAVSEGVVASALVNSYNAMNYVHGRHKFHGLQEVQQKELLPLSFGIKREDKPLLWMVNRGLSMIPREEIDGVVANIAAINMNYTEDEFLTDYSLEICLIVMMVAVIIMGLIYVLRSRLKLQAMQLKLETINDGLQNMIKEERWLKTALEESYQVAEAANHAKSDFLAAMSHDIRTPMNGILGMAAIAEKNLDNNDRVADCLRKIKGAGTHLLGLINNVLDMSKIESGKLELVEEKFDLRELVGNMEAMVRSQVQAKNHTLQIDISAVEHPELFGDGLKLQQVFVNLLSNAIKYTPDGGLIIFTGREKSTDGPTAYLEFSVKDNGIGMTEAYRQKVFDPFTRAEGSTVNKIQGTGLGMPIARNIARMMGGDIVVESVLGEGSEFIVTVYIKKQTPEEIAADKEAGAPSATAEIDNLDLTGKRVLLVEDNELNMEIAQEILLMTNVLVETAEDGQVALDKVKSSPDGWYDLVLMDIQMPNLNGYEATRAIRNLEREYTDKLPIVAMTANAFAEDVQRAREAGMDDHLAKPIEMKELATVLLKYLG